MICLLKLFQSSIRSARDLLWPFLWSKRVHSVSCVDSRFCANVAELSPAG